MAQSELAVMTGREDDQPPLSPPGHLVADPAVARQLAVKSTVAWKSFPLDLLTGATVGGVAHTVVAPIERAKLVIQTQDSNVCVMQGRRPRYKGMVDAIVRIAREEGFWALWRGNGSSVIRYYPSVALNFAFKDYYRTLLSPLPAPPGEGGMPVPPPPPAWRSAAANFAAGAAAGSTALLFTYPLDIAHTRLATDLGTGAPGGGAGGGPPGRQFRGLRGFLANVYRREGLRGLYQGFPASVHGIVVHRSVYFGGFDTAKQLLLGSEDGARSPFWRRWLLAQVSTTAAGLVAYPFDTVRHRMMMQSGQERKMYASTLDCWRSIYRDEGARAFYRGCVSNMFRGVGAALILVGYDELKTLMHRA